MYDPPNLHALTWPYPTHILLVLECLLLSFWLFLLKNTRIFQQPKWSNDITQCFQNSRAPILEVFGQRFDRGAVEEISAAGEQLDWMLLRIQCTSGLGKVSSVGRWYSWAGGRWRPAFLAHPPPPSVLQFLSLTSLGGPLRPDNTKSACFTTPLPALLPAPGKQPYLQRLSLGEASLPSNDLIDSFLNTKERIFYFYSIVILLWALCNFYLALHSWCVCVCVRVCVCVHTRSHMHMHFTWYCVRFSLPKSSHCNYFLLFKCSHTDSCFSTRMPGCANWYVLRIWLVKVCVRLST